MKYLILFLLISSMAKAQDSVLVTISQQARDIEYMAPYLFNNNNVENLYDTLKVKFRVQNEPTGNNTVNVTGLAMDWVVVITHLKSDKVAINTGCTGRVEALLRAVALPYLTTKMDALVIADTDAFQAGRKFGRFLLTRKNN